jgi:hypothetical protein
MEQHHKGWTPDGFTMPLSYMNSAPKTVLSCMHLITQPLVHYPSPPQCHGPEKSDLNLTATFGSHHCTHQAHGLVPCQMPLYAWAS